MNHIYRFLCKDSTQWGGGSSTAEGACGFEYFQRETWEDL